MILIVSGWQFKPGMKDGKAVSVPCTLDFRRGDVATAPADFPPPAPGVQRIRVGGNVQVANLVTRVPPVYPQLAKQARIQGTVRFNLLLSLEGNVQSIQLVSGQPLLIPAATDAVKQWAYCATLLNGNPVEVITQVDVNFTLIDGPPH